MRIDFSNPGLNHGFYAGINNKKANNNVFINSINFKAKHFEDNATRPSYAIKLGQKHAPEVEKRATKLQSDAMDVLFVETTILQDEAQKHYRKAVEEFYHPNFEQYSSAQEYMAQRQDYVYPSSIKIMSSPARFDAKSTKCGIAINILHDKKAGESLKEEFSLSHDGRLISYKKTIVDPKGAQAVLQNFAFDEDGKLETYQEGIKTEKNKEIIEKQITFDNGKLDTIETQNVFNKRTGKRTTKETLNFKYGKLKFVYLNISEAKNGKKTFKTKYRSDKGGNLACVFNTLI